MLIRKTNGREFHIVCGETENKRNFICLCGELVAKNCVAKQLVSEGLYVRCHVCRRIENERFVRSRAG
jgi:hypothetical protein